MATKLVIVESPAKAKTIGGYLGKDYEVEASVGHIRDLLPNARALPEDLKKKWWADYAVDVDNEFEPFYEVPAEKQAQVRKLKAALKGKDTLVLATDEDREGESISWHLLEVLKPAKSVAVKRIAFHEITKDAIKAALDNPRDVDLDLVEAQETRRVLDRLYGYTLSPILWSRVMRNLSAGRVQTPAVKLIVDREKLRRAFVSSGYWDVKATLQAEKSSFEANLKTINQQRIANGSDFDDATGQLKVDRATRIQLNEARAKQIAESVKDAKPWKIVDIKENEATESPAPPFMTTTLQQDANRKFGFSPDRTMRIAQTLYEGVTVNGEQTGLITYMRTDSLSLASSAIAGMRSFISKHYPDALPEKPRVYTSKVRNAQEAHEAIRPTDASRTPDMVKKDLTADQLKIYELIWKRAVASQMKSARVLKTEAEIEVSPGSEFYGFSATGKQVLFEGYQVLYTEAKDETEADERRLPRLSKGQIVDCHEVEPLGHTTKPPARFTEATLIRKLEENGIGRPSTYASIISVILDRGYVRKQGRALVPSFLAFLTMEVLEGNFHEFTDLDFTKNMDDALDDISEGKRASTDYLKQFFLGEHGLKTAVEERKANIPFPNWTIGTSPDSDKDIIVRIGSDGHAFLQEGPREDKKFANIPDDLAPADLTVEKAMELFKGGAQAQESFGIDPVTGRNLILKNRGGYYLEVERTQEEIDQKVKPRWISLPPGVDPHTIASEDISTLCLLPKVIGPHPADHKPITFKMGKFGAYVEWGEERRTLPNWQVGMKLTTDEAVEILNQPKGRPVRVSSAAAALKEFGELEGCAGPVKLLSGRFGPYVTDGTTNATVPKSVPIEELTAEVAQELLERKRSQGPSVAPKKRGATRAKTSKKPTAKAKKPAKKA